MSKAQVNAKMTMDTSAAQKSVTKMEGKFKTMANKMKAHMRQLGTAMGAAIGATVGVALKKALTNGLQLKVVEEEIKAVLEGAFKDNGKAASAISMLQGEVKQNPIFNEVEMMEVGKSFANYVNGSVDGLKNAVESAQFLSAMSGKPLADAAESIKGALRGEMDSLGNFLSPEAMERLGKLQKKGTMTIDDIRKEIEGAGGNQALLDKLNAGVEGQIGSVENDLNSIFKDSMSEAWPELLAILKSNSEWLAANRDQIVQMLAKLVEGMAILVSAATKYLGKGLGAWDNFTKKFGDVAAGNKTSEEAGVGWMKYIPFVNSAIDAADYSINARRKLEPFRKDMSLGDAVTGDKRKDAEEKVKIADYAAQRARGVNPQEAIVTVNINGNGVHGMTASQGGVS